MDNNKSNNPNRQKMRIKKILNKNHLQVTFSKRRAGLFKKASELCTLCGVQMAIVVFSPAGKAYSFGHLDVESVIHKFLTTNQLPLISPKRGGGEAHHLPSAKARELNVQLAHIVNQLEAQRKQGELLGQIAKAQQAECCLSIDGLGLDGLAQLRNALEELQLNIETHKISLAVAANYNCNNYEIF